MSTARSGISLTLAASADAPTLARRAAADALAHWDGERRDIALLVISELVTNAVRYGARGHADRVALSVRHRDSTTRIEVTDRRARGGAVIENVPRGSGGQRSGWGLPIVAELTDRWGVEHGPGRTCVWCEIDTV
jgi:anti-sigma regulatory factor (Ser/Thr protein kinase)